MVDGSMLGDTLLQLEAIARQTCCLAEYMRRGDIALASWLVAEMQQELSQIAADLQIRCR